ncbi:MAG: LPS export ABC transporter periplasmic protein LptC [Sphingomonadaceae bacterium]|uniref:LPS export ABC transporter periplasmic protein LptC n=1 Tax=Thermaurantiacus sp. TaxID=2820283 RepID=UPI00298F3824|nr:LPS export ABC transporter periplasmic protein LptC [Thermaurantiacus sp.]MCS6985871.1 LPS export ABC transporter periplasmic protein LptC [Sphingomonadaceae bacterium]MDW8413860.1 LPS export ABC transporter periplasmic protein LptC [Thermaurantiacus sp.]
MSERAAASLAARRLKDRRRRAMLPGSTRDRRMAVLKRLFPLLAVTLLGTLVLWPLGNGRELSFILSKETSGRAPERLRLERAAYRGVTVQGEPFAITAARAVQQSSRDPVVRMTELSARVERASGPVTVRAPAGVYRLDQNRLELAGPVEAQGAGGYRLEAERVAVDLARSLVSSEHAVSGELPMGRFRANRFEADLAGQRVVLEGDVRLWITPAAEG